MLWKATGFFKLLHFKLLHVLICEFRNCYKISWYYSFEKVKNSMQNLRSLGVDSNDKEKLTVPYQI